MLDCLNGRKQNLHFQVPFNFHEFVFSNAALKTRVGLYERVSRKTPICACGASCVPPQVMTTNDAIRLIYHSAQLAGGSQEAQRLGTLWGFAIFHGAFELPSQIMTAVLIACNIAATEKEATSSFIQVQSASCSR